MVSKQQFLDSVKPLTCNICREEFHSTHDLVEMPVCGHIFGDICIALMIESAIRDKNNSKCPMCRTQLFEHDPLPVCPPYPLPGNQYPYQLPDNPPINIMN